MNVQSPTASAAAAEVVASKTEFARLLGVSAARVSQYLGDGKITAEALQGEGRNAKIRVEFAKAQLRSRLDIDQRLGNGIGTQLDAAPAPQLPLPETGVAAPPPAAPTPDPIEAELKRLKLEQAQRANREAARQEAAAAGHYVLADDMRRELGRALREQITVFEGALTEFANAIAAEIKVPQRDVLHILRREFRANRERAAARYKAEAQDRPHLVDDVTAPQPETETAAA